jgi:hypothetical protein
MMFFFLGNVIFFANTKFMLSDKQLFISAMQAHAALLLICYPLFAVGLWRLRGS